MSVLGRAKSVFDYEAVNPDELTFGVGVIINILKDDDEGWWVGEYEGKKGWFPSNYVERLPEDAAPPIPKKSAPAVPPASTPAAAPSADEPQASANPQPTPKNKAQQMGIGMLGGTGMAELQQRLRKKTGEVDTSGATAPAPSTEGGAAPPPAGGSGGGPPPIPKKKKVLPAPPGGKKAVPQKKAKPTPAGGPKGGGKAKKSKHTIPEIPVFEPDTRQWVQALYDSQADIDGELSLVAGECIVVLEDLGDWWKGEKRTGELGVFPKNYVEDVASPVDAENQEKVRKATEEAERVRALIAEEEAAAQKAAQRKAREEAERKAKEEAKRKAREEAERKAQEEAKRKAQEEAERKARQEAEERKAREEAERKAREEAERKAKAEAEAAQKKRRATPPVPATTSSHVASDARISLAAFGVANTTVTVTLNGGRLCSVDNIPPGVTRVVFAQGPRELTDAAGDPQSLILSVSPDHKLEAVYHGDETLPLAVKQL